MNILRASVGTADTVINGCNLMDLQDPVNTVQFDLHKFCYVCQLKWPRGLNIYICKLTIHNLTLVSFFSFEILSFEQRWGTKSKGIQKHARNTFNTLHSSRWHEAAKIMYKNIFVHGHVHVAVALPNHAQTVVGEKVQDIIWSSGDLCYTAEYR